VRADLEHGSIPRMVLHSAERYAGAPAIIDGDTTMSFADVSAEMLTVGRALMARGVEPGDRVVLWAPNSARWITSALGILATGARLVPMNTRFKGPEAAFILKKTGARVLLCANGFLGADFVEMVREADPSLAQLIDVVVVDGPAPEGTTSWGDFIAGADTVDDRAVRERIEAIGPDDVSDIVFTSGTTGHPKGVLLRHGTSMRAFEAFNEGFALGRSDRLLIVLPFFHTFGYKAGWMLALMVGATSVPLAVLDPEAALRTIEQQRITHLGGSPTIFAALLDHPVRKEVDLASMRVSVVSAAYVPVELVYRMKEDLGLDYAMTGYGLTETHGIVGLTYPDDPPETVANWSCRPLEDTEVRLVDDDGNDVAMGDRGEVLFRGYSVSNGYFDEPEATAAVFSADGWLRTGDIAFQREDGYLKVCDRKKDMYIMGGFNVAPAEVEGMLTDWGKIVAAAVVGVPDDRFGEVGAAFVVPASGITLTPEEVIAYARSAMANFKVPRRVEIVEALPMNATGKVLKDELRARLAAPA
jgi:acyl-CoA synthetase (AMP-forming)/AMP-acid ligase II